MHSQHGESEVATAVSSNKTNSSMYLYVFRSDFPIHNHDMPHARKIHGSTTSNNLIKRSMLPCLPAASGPRQDDGW